MRRFKCLHNGIILIVICFQIRSEDTLIIFKNIKMNKKILGLDLGTNSIGWALIEKNDNKKTGNILGAGCRILPMSQDILGKFDSGQSISQTAERTSHRGIRRLRERFLLRRERLHRVLNILNFLPEHYVKHIDFKKRLGQFIPETEPKLAYVFNSERKKSDFIFKNSFEEMLYDFRMNQPQLLENGKKVPYDWTIYYLRKKSLKQEIAKEELAWLLLHFNQKRGYYQLREEEEEETPNKLVEFYSLKVLDVIDSGDRKSRDEIWYNVHLENGWIYRRPSKIPLDWIGKIKEFIVTTDLNDDGSVKTDKDGKEKRSFRSPAEDDWTLVKKKTEYDIDKSHKHVGEYIYDSLLQKPNQKIKGKLIRVIERKYYKAELEDILKKQQHFHPELKDENLYNACLEELYPYNEPHKNSIVKRDFIYLFVNDIIFYQRPLKSKKSLISNCKFELRKYKDKDDKLRSVPLKGIAKSHPLFQEFRLWQFIQNIKIYKKETPDDINATDLNLNKEEDYTKLFEWLNERKEIDQKTLLKYFKIKNADNYRWNYVEDKTYPCNETRTLITSRLKKTKNIPAGFLTKEKEEALWHILYSVDDKNDIVKALKTFASKNGLEDDFIEQFKKFPRIEKEYGAYSAKAIKKLLPLMRIGPYWDEAVVINNVENYQKNIQTLIGNLKTKNENIKEEDREKGKAINTSLLERLETFSSGETEAYKGLEHFLASYIVYGKHSEDSDALQWKTPGDIECYLKSFRQHSLRNPIVEQVIRETLRVVKDIWTNFGNGSENFFDEIHLELGREMKNPAEKRKQMTNQINENENTNLRIKALLVELMNDDDTENVRPYSPMQQEILKIYEEGVLSAEYGKIPDDITRILKQAVPASEDLKKYKLWLQQGYHSPYTGNLIPLSKLFTRAYDIEHIIPQSRYFDDSLSNKIICETEVNGDKGNMTAYEYIRKKGGSKVALNFGKEISLLSPEAYEDLIKRNFAKSRSKMKKLLTEEIPEGFIERQMNDSRYISKVVKNLLSNIVRQDNEQEVISKKIIPVTGAITAHMKQDWGLEHIWTELITPRFIRLNELTQSKKFGDINITTKKFLPQVPLELQKGFSKKRIDHRHHALDAIVIACITKEHINYLNSINSERKNYSLVSRLRKMEEVIVNGQMRKVPKEFHKPWDTFTQETRETLNGIVVSFKQNLRVINKTVNHYRTWEKDENGEPVKKFKKQIKGNNWAIRKPMHKDTVSGLLHLKLKKTVPLSAALDNWDMIINKELREQIKKMVTENTDKKKIIKFFKDKNNLWNNIDISKIEIYYWNKENVASRVKLDESFNSSKIESISDTGIKKILLNHLSKFHEENNGKIIEHPDLAFSSDGIDVLNKHIQELNGGKPHHSIYKVRTYEPKGNKFRIGQTGNKKDKYVEAAKGTNLFFAIYGNEAGKRIFETIPLNIVIERQKQYLSPTPDINESGHKLIMYLSPNDLVYVPTEEERKNINQMNFRDLNGDQLNRLYKIISFSGSRLYALPNAIAKSIVDKVEFTQLNKLEFSIDRISIKEVCIKINVDKLGNISLSK